MKKIKDIIKYHKYQRQRVYRECKRRQHYKLWRKARNRFEQGIPKLKLKEIHKDERSKWKFHNIEAPKNLSFIENTEEVIEFIREIERCRKKKKWVFVKLEDVENVDYGAIVVLLSIVVTFKADSLNVGGDFPRNEKTKTELLNSGFFESLAGTFANEERYKIVKKGYDGIHTHAYKKVDAELGAKIIESASKVVWGDERRCQGVQRSLIELMHNTNNHAEIGRKGEKHWWLSVRYDPESKKVCFAFVDFGVGIFENLNNKTSDSKWFGWTRKLAKRVRYGNNADILKLMMNGDFHEIVTKKYYRGKGLPGIADAQKRNQISNLRIVTNDVYCSYGNNEYRKMDASFSGTFVYWELNENNEFCKSNRTNNS